jgi:hypothetical protein
MTTTRGPLPADIVLKSPSDRDGRGGEKLVYRGDTLIGRVWKVGRHGQWDAWRASLVNSKHPEGGDTCQDTRTNAVLRLLDLYRIRP